MFKHILIATDGSNHSLTAAKYAVSISKKYQATVKALNVIDVKLLEGPFLRDVSASVAIDPSGNYQRNISAILEKRGQAALDAVAQICKKAGIECETVMVTGTVPRAIREHARLADLLVMGQHGEHAQWADGLMGSTVDSVIRCADRPMLVAGLVFNEFSRVLAAYDGSDASAKSLGMAATFCVEWQLPITVATVEDDKEKGLRVLDEAKEYLSTYGLDAQFELINAEPADGIIDCAEMNGCDLIVMGAYGHSRVRNLILGSTTSRVVHRSRIPVLLNR